MVPGQLTNQPPTGPWITGRAAVTPQGAPNWRPPGAMPSQQQLSYWKEAITLLLLVLALPWLAFKLVTNPGTVLTGAGRKAVHGKG